jgi:hypothetical protein
MNCRRLWLNHGLTIASAAFTAVCWIIGPFIQAPRLYDFVMNLGHASFSVVLLYGFAAKLKEVNKPEED